MLYKTDSKKFHSILSESLFKSNLKAKWLEPFMDNRIHKLFSFNKIFKKYLLKSNSI